MSVYGCFLLSSVRYIKHSISYVAFFVLCLHAGQHS